MTHSEVCLVARKKLKEAELAKLARWVESGTILQFEVGSGKDVYSLLKKISSLAEVSFTTVTRRVDGGTDKWKNYRIHNWSPTVKSLQELMQALNIIIKIKLN